MAANHAVLTDRVKEILRSCRSEGGILYLPPDRLPAQEYDAVNAVLKDWGGKWNRHKEGHVFDGEVDVEAKMADVEKYGSYSSRKANHFYQTPESLLSTMLNISIPWWDAKILEPSAGRGAIADYMCENGANIENVDVVEIMPEHRTILTEKGYRIIGEDFLEMTPDPVYDLIYMNPPFNKGADVLHILHASQFLAPGGSLVAIGGASIDFGNRKLDVQLRELIFQWNGSIDKNPAGSFKDAGTMVNTVMVTMYRDDEYAHPVSIAEPVAINGPRQLSLTGD